MGDKKIAASDLPQPQPHCPSGEDRFAKVVQQIKADNQLSREEVSAIVACQYGNYLPPAVKPGGEPMSADEMYKAGYIGNFDKVLEGLSDVKAIREFSEFAPSHPGSLIYSDAHIKEQIISAVQAQDAERIAHIQKRNITETAMFFKVGDSITPVVPESRKAGVDRLARDLSAESLGRTSDVGGSSTVQGNIPETSRVMMHESVHQHAHQNFSATRLPMPLIEGMTEYFSMNALRNSGKLHGAGSQPQFPYLMEMGEIYRLRAIVGEEVLRNACFKGDIAGLKTAFENKVGEGSWQKYTNIVMQSGLDSGISGLGSLVKDPVVLEEIGKSMVDFKKMVDGALALEPIKGKVE